MTPLPESVTVSVLACTPSAETVPLPLSASASREGVVTVTRIGDRAEKLPLVSITSRPCQTHQASLAAVARIRAHALSCCRELRIRRADEFGSIRKSQRAP